MNRPRRDKSKTKQPWEGIALSTTQTDALKELWELLGEAITGSGTASEAFHQIVEAIGDYEAHSSRVWNPTNDSFYRSMPEVARAREELRSIEASVKSAHSQLQKLSPTARRLLAKTTGLLPHEFDRVLVPHLKAARRAARKAEGLPNKPVDHARVLLARDIAQIVCDTLKKHASSTRPDPDGTHPKGGALYARVLVATLKVVGIGKKSAEKLIDPGLRLLSKPELERGDVPE